MENYMKKLSTVTFNTNGSSITFNTNGSSIITSGFRLVTGSFKARSEALSNKYYISGFNATNKCYAGYFKDSLDDHVWNYVQCLSYFSIDTRWRDNLSARSTNNFLFTLINATGKNKSKI